MGLRTLARHAGHGSRALNEGRLTNQIFPSPTLFTISGVFPPAVPNENARTEEYGQLH
jgi:hypothetical protein